MSGYKVGQVVALDDDGRSLSIRHGATTTVVVSAEVFPHRVGDIVRFLADARGYVTVEVPR